MDDASSADRILRTHGPAVGELGGGVILYDDNAWRGMREGLAYVGMREEFFQNSDIALGLPSTGKSALEASSAFGRVWETGIDPEDPGFGDMTGWRG